MPDQERIERKWAALEPWAENFDSGMERRGADGYSWYDVSLLNALPREKDVAIIVTAWSGQLKWLEATLRAYRETGAFVILAYDQHFFPWAKPAPTDMFRSMPNPRHFQLASATVFKHLTGDAAKRNGWFWSVRYAQGILKSFPNIKKVYLTNGDCLFQKPEGFPELLRLVDDCDLISGQTTTSGNIHTANVLFKREAFDQVFDYIENLMRVPVLGSRSPEGNLREAVARLGLKLGIPEKLPLDLDGTVDSYCRYGQDSTWKEIVGFRNLFAEYEQAANDGLELDWLKPYNDNFMDWLYWSGEERAFICKYWETGDRRYLYQFWDAGEGSDYDRLYYPLEYFGVDPIYKEVA
jgi:hypothetical protein